MSGRKILVFDDVLTVKEAETVRDAHFCLSEPEPIRWVDKGNEPYYMTKLINIAAEHFDISNAVGYDWWTQINTFTYKGWHIDYEEKPWTIDRTLNVPLCSLIYYPLAAHVKGGELWTDDLKIPAKTNRLIMMSNNIPHKIAPYNVDDSDRWSLLINPFDHFTEGTVKSWHVNKDEQNL